MTCILVSDPDPRSRRRATSCLRLAGFEVKTARDRQQMVSLLRRRQLGGVVIDPGADDPIEVIKDLRTRDDLPIIVVSDQGEEHGKVELLDAGADDYLTKPFGAEELAARVRAVLRRVQPTDERPPVVTDDFTICLADRRFIRNDGTEVALTPTEWTLVEVLVSHATHLVAQADVLRTVWGPDAEDKSAHLRVHMSNIRHKLEPDPGHPRYFLTMAGLGLRFDPGG